MNLDKNWQKKSALAINYLFILAFILLLLFSVMEILKPKIILNYLNLDIFILAVLLLGVVSIFLPVEKKESPERLKAIDYSAMIMLAILSGLFCLYLTRAIGYLSILIGLSASIIVFYIIYNYKTEN